MYELSILARGGVLLTVWALAAGWPPGRLAARLRRDGWQRICRGAWAVPGKETDWRVRETALQLLGPRRVCRYGTAARLHRVELLAPAPDPGACRASLPPEDVCLRRGLRATTAARTVADLIRASGSREAAVVAADSALSGRVAEGVRRGPLVRREDLATQLAVRRPGAPRARAWLRLAHPAAGSPAETVARLRMADAGLFPACQPPLRTPAGRPLHPDFLFREAGLAVEVEGFAYHGTRRAHERDIARFNALQSCPEIRRVLRFTAREVFAHPDRMTAEIRTALAELTR
ncbi:endonuclease domain-containing protein [Streptomyces sp. NPDC057854]|uniref:endonuclease domain-containing protein n=1 Tax=unclassified Streptomyces TaxID=2593676 RepID=UPI0036B22556